MNKSPFEVEFSKALGGNFDNTSLVPSPLAQQLAHPFYKRTDELRTEVKMETLKKAAEKYPEPFNPHSWTAEQLVKHAMAENYDQSNYINGLYEKLVEIKKNLDRVLFHLDTEDISQPEVVSEIQKQIIEIMEKI